MANLQQASRQPSAPRAAHSKQVLLIGGHGKIAQLTIPRLRAAGFEVAAVIRNPAQQARIQALGAHPVLADVTQLDDAAWQELACKYDVFVWSAGNGGVGGSELTYAVDRDAAIASMRAAQAVGELTPQYIMVSYAFSQTYPVPELAQRSAFDHYAAAKQQADQFLFASQLDYVVLGPTALTAQPATGITLLPEDLAPTKLPETSRALVASVIVYMAQKQVLPRKLEAFHDGAASLEVLSAP